MIEVLTGVVIGAFLAESLSDAGGIALIGIELAITDLVGEEVCALTTAAAEQEIVVVLVLCSGARAIEDGGGGSFETDDNGTILGVGKNVAAQAVILPTKVLSVVEAAVYVFPISSIWLLNICIGRDVG